MSETKYESLGNDDLTPEQLEGMEMWGCDEMLDKRHRAVGSYLVKRAVAEIWRRRAADAPGAERMHAVVRDAVRALAGMGQWPPPMELCEAIADRVVSQLALSSADPTPSHQTIAEAFIAGAAWVNDHAQITDSGCGASVDIPADWDIEKAADQFAADGKAPDVAAAVRHLHETSERAPDVRTAPMRLVRQDAFDALLALIGGKR